MTRNTKQEFIVVKDIEFYNKLTDVVDEIDENNFFHKEYILLPKYGQGIINKLIIGDIEIIISNYTLRQDLIINRIIDEDIIQLSFLLKGEKIISIDGSNEDIIYENQESYLATVKSLKGNVKIFGQIPFKEIKIRMNSSFMMTHSFNSQAIFKQFLTKKLIIPINDELLNSLNDLQNYVIKGESKALYLKAKVFELLANQTENYKLLFKYSKKHDKIIKKLYQIKRIIKDNFKKHYTVAELAKKVFINERTLNSEFLRVFECSINEFSTKTKMDKAKQLLLNTAFPIYQISEEIGFKNATHFSAAFKRYTRQTPNQFRNIYSVHDTIYRDR